MFPFRFSSRSPVPPYSQTSADAFMAEKNKVLNCVKSFVMEFINNIKTSDDINNINFDSFKQDFNVLLERNLAPKR